MEEVESSQHNFFAGCDDWATRWELYSVHVKDDR